MQAGSRLTEARALVPAILEDADSLVVTSAEVTSTGMAVLMVARPDSDPCFVIKIPMTPQAADGLRREDGVLASLHADDRLGELRHLIPRPLAAGVAGHRPYRVDAALPGKPAIQAQARARLLDTAAETIHVLHRATATYTQGDDPLARSWVDARLSELWPHGVRGRLLRARIERLRDELHGAVLGTSFRASWVHGDFWLGNLLVADDAETIRGIVDWDAAAGNEPAVHDVIHLLLYTRRMATGQELGRLVRSRLRGAPWPDHERELLERYGTWCHDGALSDRHSLLLYWLRQVAAHARQQGGRGGPRYRVWERRNVHPVLAEL
jgi:aminoglycoside phosphotransferase (APT) family kinase protein